MFPDTSPVVELYNQNTELLDNMTVYFETLDTCFCHGYCGCSVRCVAVEFKANQRNSKLAVDIMCMKSKHNVCAPLAIAAAL